MQFTPDQPARLELGRVAGFDPDPSVESIQPDSAEIQLLQLADELELISNWVRGEKHHPIHVLALASASRQMAHHIRSFLGLKGR